MNSIRQASLSLAILLILLLINLSPLSVKGFQEPNSPNSTFTIVDTLGEVAPSTQFSVFGSGGPTISDFSQRIGPKFTLTQRTRITEIGAFVDHIRFGNECPFSLCAPTFPLTVEIHPSRDGVPDIPTVIASFLLSEDFDPLVISYSSVNPNLVLEPGTYFAIFVPRPENIGFILGSASFPFPYLPGVAVLGIIDPSIPRAFLTEVPAAVRILGKLPFDTCIQNDGGQFIIKLDMLSGEYEFTNCNGLAIGGTGRITTRGCLTVLEDNRPDRRVLVRINSCTRQATAAVQLFSQGTTFNITDRDISNNSCACN